MSINLDEYIGRLSVDQQLQDEKEYQAQLFEQYVRHPGFHQDTRRQLLAEYQHGAVLTGRYGLRRKLGAIDLVNPHTSIGRNTAQAMQVGIVYGEADRVDGLVNRIFEQLGYKAAVVATGGLARRVAPLSRTITHVNQDLTLEGLRLVYDNFMDNDVTGLYGRPDEVLE